jgi:uncharacterized NAD-dependent epimerase/dehydratase family protein
MKKDPAIVYCESAFNTPNGKTAHGLVRFTKRYEVLAVIDSRYAGKDAGEILDRVKKHIPLVNDLPEALAAAQMKNSTATHFVIGLAPDGGKLDPKARQAVIEAVKHGLHVDCGLHDFLSEDQQIAALARDHHVRLRDIRKPPSRERLHFFSGKIEEVTSLKIAVLGTDSAIGKRTTAWLLVHGLQEKGISAEMIGTGQTAWMQGAEYSIVEDSIVSDFLTGEIEHVVWKAWHEKKADVLVIEGQGSLLNPAYPGGFEIIAGGRPDLIIIQHAPARKTYDGFPAYAIQPLPRQIEAVEMIAGKPVIAVTLNHEHLDLTSLDLYIQSMTGTLGLPVFDVLAFGASDLAGLIISKLIKQK